MRRPWIVGLVGALAVGAVAVGGCGAGGGPTVNERPPAAPVTVLTTVAPSSVAVQPTVGAVAPTTVTVAVPPPAPVPVLSMSPTASADQAEIDRLLQQAQNDLARLDAELGGSNPLDEGDPSR